MIEERQYQQGPKRRILSIDGGGILGTFPAAFLAELEQHLKYPIGAYFDLIAGTSTGGILAIGLAMGLPASKLLDLYEKRGPDVFGQNYDALQGFVYRILRSIQWLYRRKYDSNALRSALQDVFGNKRIGEATTRLMVPAWNPVAQCVYIYKTAHHPRLKTDYRSFAVDAALATSAAPTYFQHHITQHDVGLLDGGVWANNPIGIAAVEATGCAGLVKEFSSHPELGLSGRDLHHSKMGRNRDAWSEYRSVVHGWSVARRDGHCQTNHRPRTRSTRHISDRSHSPQEHLQDGRHAGYTRVERSRPYESS